MIRSKHDNIPTMPSWCFSRESFRAFLSVKMRTPDGIIRWEQRYVFFHGGRLWQALRRVALAPLNRPIAELPPIFRVKANLIWARSDSRALRHCISPLFGCDQGRSPRPRYAAVRDPCRKCPPSPQLRPAGLEPATSGLGNRCSILLSYGRKAPYYNGL
jgi:hypothetical protein